MEAVKFIPAFILLILYITVAAVAEDIDIASILTITFFLGVGIAVPIFKLTLSEKFLKGLKIAYLVCVPVAAFLLTEAYMNDQIGRAPYRIQIIILNLLFYYILEFLVLAVTTRSDVAAIVTVTVPTILGIANNLSIQARDLPIYPWDILSAGTALSVVDNYEMTLSQAFLACTFAVTAIIFISVPLNIRFKMKRGWMWCIPVTVAVMLVSGYLTTINSIFKTEDKAIKYGFYPYLFSAKYLYSYNGTPVTFLYTLKYLHLSPPSDYDTDALKELYYEYQEMAKKDAEEKKESVRPNIIVIMNEAFSDPKVLGEFTTNEDYIPFINSLRGNENVSIGSTIVSVKGGNTPNSEFEFLTGTTMAFLPSESIPYQQFIKGNTYSIVSQLNDLGYRTVAMHNYNRAGWQREKVYDYLGFDEKYFLEDMRPIYESEVIRNYMSDQSMYDRLYKLYEEKGDGEPFFFFGVTMQNHGGYFSDRNFGYEPNISVTFDSGMMYENIEHLNTYLSLLSESDKAFENLINYYSEVDEPTIILMFGDHQPNDVAFGPIMSEYGYTDTDVATRQLRYRTPYIMWSNFDTDMSNIPADTSLCYLSGFLCEAAGIPLTPFQIWQRELRAQYPIINSFCYADKDKNYYSIAGLKKIELMSLFEKFQYNLIFDRKNTAKEFFSPVIIE